MAFTISHRPAEMDNKERVEWVETPLEREDSEERGEREEREERAGDE